MNKYLKRAKGASGKLANSIIVEYSRNIAEYGR